MQAEQIQSIDVLSGMINAGPQARDPGDDGLGVQFLMHSHLDDAKTREAGRPIFEMREYIRITIPGDMTGNVFRPAFEGDHQRFPRQFLAFKAGGEQAQGMPLSEWTQITRAQVDELAWFKITTVEQLASVSDSNAQKFMGLNQLRKLAQIYLETVKADAPMQKVMGELATRDEEIANLKRQMSEMQEFMARQNAKDAAPVEEAPEPPRRRRLAPITDQPSVDA
jgi:hypothetical protein